MYQPSITNRFRLPKQLYVAKRNPSFNKKDFRSPLKHVHNIQNKPQTNIILHKLKRDYL